jgi:hypothetical protein
MDFFVDFSRQPQKIGSFFTLKSEIQLISKLSNDPHSIVYCVPGPLKKLNENFTSIMTDDVNQVEIVYVAESQTIHRNKYPDNILNELNDYTYFSTARLRYLFKTFGVVPSLNWGTETNLVADLLVSKLNYEYFTFHISEPFSFQDSNEYFDGWNVFLKKLRSNTNVPFIFVGNFNLLNNIDSFQDMYFLNDLGYSLQQQARVISQGKYFIGTASGMCTPAMLGKIPYVIFKHPKYHELEMGKELIESRLPWATKNQSFKLTSISSEILDTYLNELVMYEKT